MMLNCWSRNPNERSTFTELRNKLTEMIAEMVPNNYLNLFLDETRDYYQIETTSTGSSEDDEAPQLEGQGSICPSRGQSSNRGPRTVSESTKGGDSGVGDKSSTSTSHVTLHSSNQSFDACGGSSSSGNVFNPPTSQPLTSTSWFHNKIFDMEASNLSVCAAVTTKPEEISTKVKRSPEKNGSHNFSASFPILVRLQKPYSGNHQRTSTSSMEQLIPGQSLSGETLDSGSHSWIAGQTSV